MKNIFSIKTLLLAASAAVLAFSACRKGDFDVPPIGGDVVILTPTTTVAQLKAMHSSGAFETIKDDLILEATVIADDKSGNFYKQLFVQDATGGIEIAINATNLYAHYPIGRKVYVKLQGLVLGDGDGAPKLGGYLFDNALQGIVQSLLPKFVLKGGTGAAIAPTRRKISELSPADYSTLVELTDVEFGKSDTSKTFADALGKATANRTLFDCSNLKITLRTSGYASFAGTKCPSGHGSAIGVVTRYGTTDQLFVRDASEVVMNDARCGSGGGPVGNLVAMDIADLRDFYAGATTTAPVDKKIKGIVISDKSAGNITSKNLVIQDGTAGITVRFAATNTFNLGDEVEINISNVELSEYSKLLQLNNVPLANATKISSGNTVAPRVATVAEVNANQAAWESTLVQIVGATITGAGGTFSGSTTANDGTGTITIYTPATFPMASTALPTGPKKVTAIVSQYNTTNQLNLRNASDIQ